MEDVHTKYTEFLLNIWCSDETKASVDYNRSWIHAKASCEVCIDKDNASLI